MPKTEKEMEAIREDERKAAEIRQAEIDRQVAEDYPFLVTEPPAVKEKQKSKPKK